MAVILFHYFPRTFPGGYLGVDVFFVISGYLITKLIYFDVFEGSFSFSSFYGRRIRRIFPALLLVCASTLLVGWFSLTSRELYGLAESLIAGLLFYSNFLLLNEGSYFRDEAFADPFLHLWSLSIEEQFYLLWPICLYFLFRRTKQAFIVVFILIILSFIWMFMPHLNREVSFYHPISRFWELGLGGLVAIYYSRGSARVREGSGQIISRLRDFVGGFIALPTLGFFLLLSAFFILDSKLFFLGYPVLLPVLGATLVVVGSSLGQRSIILRNNTLRYLGFISYPLYLWHWPIFSLLKIFRAGSCSGLDYFIALLLTLVLSCITAEIIEAYFRRPDHPRFKVCVLLFTSCAVTAASLEIYRHWGMPQRQSKVISDLFSQKVEASKVPRGKSQCNINIEQEESPNRFLQVANRCSIRVRKPSSHLWLYGDSHASVLFDAFDKLLPKEFVVSRTTVSGCAPWGRGYKHAVCDKNGSDIVQAIKQARPDILVLSSSKFLLEPERNLKWIRGTFSGLKDTKIVVIGTVPIWQDSVPRVLLAVSPITFYRRLSLTDLELRRSRGILLSTQVNADDRAVSFIRSSQLPFFYYSSIRKLCNAEGCLAVVPKAFAAMYTDANHLSKLGSEFLVADLLGKLNLDSAAIHP